MEHLKTVIENKKLQSAFIVMGVSCYLIGGLHKVIWYVLTLLIGIAMFSILEIVEGLTKGKEK